MAGLYTQSAVHSYYADGRQILCLQKRWQVALSLYPSKWPAHAHTAIKCFQVLALRPHMQILRFAYAYKHPDEADAIN